MASSRNLAFVFSFVSVIVISHSRPILLNRGASPDSLSPYYLWPAVHVHAPIGEIGVVLPREANYLLVLLRVLCVRAELAHPVVGGAVVVTGVIDEKLLKDHGSVMAAQNVCVRMPSATLIYPDSQQKLNRINVEECAISSTVTSGYLL